jgi:hypothetical protein
MAHRPPTWETRPAHAQRRALQRYGLRLSFDDCCCLANRIRAEDARTVLIERRSNNLALWLVRWPDGDAGRWLPVLYNRRHHYLETVLPLRELLLHRDRLAELGFSLAPDGTPTQTTTAAAD